MVVRSVASDAAYLEFETALNTWTEKGASLDNPPFEKFIHGAIKNIGVLFQEGRRLNREEADKNARFANHIDLLLARSNVGQVCRGQVNESKAVSSLKVIESKLVEYVVWLEKLCKKKVPTPKVS